MYPAAASARIATNRSPGEESIMEVKRKFWVEQRSHAIWAVELPVA